MTLRERQQKAVDDIIAAYKRGKRAPVLVMPTGGGKTFTAAKIIRRALAKGNSVWFLAHLREILGATAGKLKAEGIPHGFIMAGQDGDRHQQVQIASVQTLVRRLDRYAPPSLLIVDEAHLAVADTYQQIFQWAKAGPKFGAKDGAHLLHLTATPLRLDGRGLGEIADCIISTCSTGDLISEGLLAPVRYYAPHAVDTSQVSMRGGEFAADELEQLMDKPRITGSAVAEWMKVARHRPTIVFCVSVKHAENTAEAFRQAGVRARAVSGETGTDERDAALADLQAGRLDVVCNAQLWVAGVDAPTVSCIVQLAPTNSLTKFLQSVGRGLRIAEGKPDCVILDHAGNIGRHGSPLDARIWTLDGGQKKAKANREVPVKTCPCCFRTVMAAATDCQCGHHFETKPRTIEEVEGELAEVELRKQADAAQVLAEEQARRDARVGQGKTKDLEALVKLAVARGYKRPELWARAVLTGRAARDERRRA
jgi:superfamily II DNA or RNA helicase